MELRGLLSRGAVFATEHKVAVFTDPALVTGWRQEGVSLLCFNPVFAFLICLFLTTES